MNEINPKLRFTVAMIFLTDEFHQFFVVEPGANPLDTRFLKWFKGLLYLRPGQVGWVMTHPGLYHLPALSPLLIQSPSLGPIGRFMCTVHSM